jgi:site-specific DNA-methyltransferase (adenine-specific)
MSYVLPCKAETFVPTLENESIHLVLTDPPFYGIVGDAWDNQWKTPEEFSTWLVGIFAALLPKLTPTGSLVFFGGIGKHGEHPLFSVVTGLEKVGYTYRNWLTWKKRRAYGKEKDYLFLREEILWFSRSTERTEVTFNKPYTGEKRGYQGWDHNHPALSEYKRVGNVWTNIDPVLEDCPELMRPKRSCQKPPELMDRLVTTHSNKGDLVVDPFSGWGSTGISSVSLGRKFQGCEAIEKDALEANLRVETAVPDRTLIELGLL